jgi:superfamily I DNA/RNA helicase
MAFKKPTRVAAAASSSKGFSPTVEQVTNADLVAQGKDVKIVAGAGTGKSSSLRYIATRVPEKNILVLCFNKANADESNCHPDKPENIYYATINSIAYGKVVDAGLRKKLSFLSYIDLEQYDIQEYCALPYEKAIAATKAVIAGITAYCRSDKENVYDTVYDYLWYNHSFDSTKEDVEVNFQDNTIKELAVIAGKYWNELVHGKSSISHDVYLKLYQLAGYKIEEFYDKAAKRYISIDILALDESQDTNPVSEAIFRNQEHLQRVIVGDPMQQLYAWRGAKDIMSLAYYDSFAVGYLSESFRFNQGIADIANFVLGKADSKLRLIGSGTKSTIDSRAVLCRTNARVVEHLLHLMNTTESKLYTSIDLKDTFSKLYHMEAAWFDSVPKYPCKELAHIVDRASLLKAIEMSDEIARLHKLRGNLVGAGQTITSVKKALEERLVSEPQEADIIVSTIHKSKGLQYAHVRIADDFISTEEDARIEAIREKLWDSFVLKCMLYVAVTRAEVEVLLPWYLQGMCDESGDTEEYAYTFDKYENEDVWTNETLNG